MKQLIVGVFILTFFMSSSYTKTEVIYENDKEWETLFDGKTLNGWHRFNLKGVKSIWTVKNGVLTFDPNLIPKGNYVHDLVTDKIYKNFQLSIEWNISEGGNSGIFWGVQEGKSISNPYLTAPEIQIIDNDRHPDAKEKLKFHQAGAVYDLVEPSKDVCKPAGQWNHVILTIDHNKNQGSVKLNGTKILEFPLRGEKWKSLVANSKFSDECEYKRFAKLKSGKIALQDHGDKVSFRNIKIRKL
ncbi:MAG: glycosyl hydrolase [Flavobacteriaceae bacterium TMED179]|nr:MAG: glycosyl hydrolase [Flavobacteriaceae bacterium TMED179]|tara:strand:+ start:26478 stop:27206 length:729 start_codon:yes stop_codon:yes gene_type:complete